jgi:preprotein translocase subunit SecY
MASNAFLNIFRVPELRKRLTFILFSLIVYRVGSYIPVPGINAKQLADATKAAADGSGPIGLMDLLNLFVGGALEQFSVLALGIMPYISASIIMQLLQVVIPKLERLAKEEGDYGRKKIQKYTKYGTIVLCVVQAFGLLLMFKSRFEATLSAIVPGGTGFWFTFGFVLAITTGTMFLLWLGEQMTDRGVGNGVSLLIFAGIVARMPQAIWQTIQSAQTGEVRTLNLLIVAVIFGVVIGLVTGEQQAQRKIPVQYAKRVIGNKIVQAQSNFIPFKINPSGVIPVIFASSVMMFPSQILQMIGGESRIIRAILRYIAYGEPMWVVLYMLLVMFFAYFYTAIQLNPAEIAKQLQKNGGFIPGIRPGPNTQQYLAKVLNRITLPGSLFLGAIAVFPTLIAGWFKIPSNLAYLMGGTSLLIMVGVALDTVSQIESHLLVRNYPGFLKKGKMKSRRG